MEQRLTRIKYFLASNVNMERKKRKKCKTVFEIYKIFRSYCPYEVALCTNVFIHNSRKYIYIYLHELIPVKELIASRACCPIHWRGVKKRVNHFVCYIYIYFAKFNKKRLANITRKAGIVRGRSDFPPLIIRFVIHFEREYGNQFSSIVSSFKGGGRDL